MKHNYFYSRHIEYTISLQRLRSELSCMQEHIKIFIQTNSGKYVSEFFQVLFFYKKSRFKSTLFCISGKYSEQVNYWKRQSINTISGEKFIAQTYENAL